MIFIKKSLQNQFFFYQNLDFVLGGQPGGATYGITAIVNQPRYTTLMPYDFASHGSQGTFDTIRGVHFNIVGIHDPCYYNRNCWSTVCCDSESDDYDPNECEDGVVEEKKFGYLINYLAQCEILEN